MKFGGKSFSYLLEWGKIYAPKERQKISKREADPSGKMPKLSPESSLNTHLFCHVLTQ